MSKPFNFPGWKGEAWLWIAIGAVGLSGSLLIFAEGALSSQDFVKAFVGVPIGALCGYLAWGYWENVGRKN